MPDHRLMWLYHQTTLKDIYDNSLILLYRLLFILYTETRDLLPVHENAGYGKHYSLDNIKRNIQSNLTFQIPLLPNTATIWGQLKALFLIIREGSPTLDVSTFNGGLFNPERHPFLEKYAVGDYHLQLAIDKLARVDGQFVDYRDLSERHIGTIYEGLLEFHLETMASPEEGWTIDLKNEKGERKATGSYYTPDYVVKYMVEETLGPVLRNAIASAKTEQEKIQAVLSIKVLDPAMGSGHFPVEATEYIARFLVEHIEQSLTDTGGETELAYWRRRVVQSCIYGVDLNPLAVNLAQLSLWLATVAKGYPLSFLDHHLRCGNSLVGARFAELRADAVGVKKNGKKARTPSPQNGDVAQSMLLDEEGLRQELTDAVDLMQQIEMNPAQTAPEVKRQEHIYRELRQELTDKYSRLANLVSATHFGVAIHQALWKPLADYATGRILLGTPQFDAWLQAADAAFDTYHFFHWELEFPEVFFDHHGQHTGLAAGFDAVIGNPPYVRQEDLGVFKPYFAAMYPETHDGFADLYIYFYQQGLKLTRVNGQMSYIVTNKWMRAGYGQRLRAYFAEEGVLKRIIDFGHAPIFEDADVFPCILVLQKPQPPEGQERQPERQVRVLSFPREELSRIVQKQESLGSYVQQHSHSLPHSRFSSATWNLETSAVDDLLAKIRRVGLPLAEFAGVRPLYGIKTGLNEAFLIDTLTKERLVRDDPRCAEIIKPYLRGQDIKRWSPEWADLWMILLKSSSDHSWPWSKITESIAAEACFQKTYPALYERLKPLEERLRVRQDKGRFWWELRACAYYHIFEQPKIMYQEIQFHPAYCFARGNLLSNNKAFFLACSDAYLLAVLNSPLMWWHNWRYLPHMKDEALSPVGELMEALPIAPPSDTLRAKAEQAVSRLIDITRAIYEARQNLLTWLQVEFEVQEPGKRLENFVALDPQAFVNEVRKRRPTTAKKLTPATLRTLQDGYTEQVTPIQQYKTEAIELERTLSDLVNVAYHLTPEEIALLSTVAPPRMPFSSTL